MKQSADDPIDCFGEWFQEAIDHKDIREANAVNLATASKEGIPHNRMVLLKDYDKEGFVFYTNTESRKGCDLQENPFAAMCFYWEPQDRQVRIEGKTLPVSAEESDNYFSSRPLKSRIGAWASKQSRPLESKAALLKEVAEQSVRFATGKVERPPFWSGFRLVPHRIEFWQKGEYRIHDRVCFEKDDDEKWIKSLLYP